MTSPLNPFARLTREIAQKVLADHRLKAQAEQRLKHLLASYEELAQDPRYKAIRQEMVLILGDYLRDLVEAAQKCPRCGPKAAQITTLQKVVAEPLEEVWFERQQETVEPAFDEAEEEVIG
mgnify:CR=1 FL=1